MKFESEAKKITKSVRIDPLADTLLKVLTDYWNDIEKDDREWKEVDVLEKIIVEAAKREGFKVKGPAKTVIEIEPPKKDDS